MYINFAMRYISRYLGHDAIRIAILVYRVIQRLYLHIFSMRLGQCNIMGILVLLNILD